MKMPGGGGEDFGLPFIRRIMGQVGHFIHYIPTMNNRQQWTAFSSLSHS